MSVMDCFNNMVRKERAAIFAKGQEDGTEISLSESCQVNGELSWSSMEDKYRPLERDQSVEEYTKNIHHKRAEKGFTLMELLIVLALIAVISMIAVPIYRSYVQGAKITEGLVLSSSIQLEAEVYYTLNGQWPNTSNSHEVLRLPTPEDYAGNSVESIMLRGNEITVLYNDEIIGEENGTPVSLVLTANTNQSGAIHWDCVGKNIAEEDLPTGCAR